MALDGAFLHLVRNELEILIGNRITKIHQPSREEIILSFRDRKVLLCVNGNNSRVHLTEFTPENPKQPPMFCMVLRKHFQNAKLVSISQDGLERILTFNFEHINEIGDSVRNSIIIEIMGRYSNIILVQDDKIIDTLKRSEDVTAERLLLPGAKYLPPKREKRLNFLTDNYKDGLNNITNFKDILTFFEGISPIVANEWINFAVKNDVIDYVRLNYIIEKTKEQISENKTHFNILYKDNMPQKFSYMKLFQFGNMFFEKEFSTACETLEKFFAEKSAKNNAKQYSDKLLKLLINRTERITKRLNLQKIELENCTKKENFRICGEVISANIYQIKQGEAFVKLVNFYDNSVMDITLDPKLSPAQNAQNYFKKYKKLVTAERVLKEQIENGLRELDYVESVFEALTRAETEGEISQIRLELEQTGYVKKTVSKQKSASPKPLKFELDGFNIYVGRNNLQNDLLTKNAEKSDIWLHTQKIHGSHVVIETGEKQITDKVLEFAAKFAARHSKAKKSTQVPVDWTFVKFVKKPNGAKPGFVIYTNQKTIFINPTEER
jgi:predicted ribosome quality control (RQC) complex YloA/Tae2 family protein